MTSSRFPLDLLQKALHSPATGELSAAIKPVGDIKDLVPAIASNGAPVQTADPSRR